MTNEERPVETVKSALPEHLRHSICASCARCKTVRSGKGSVFLLCEVGLQFPAWPKYPAQPVARCRYFAEAIKNEDGST